MHSCQRRRTLRWFPRKRRAAYHGEDATITITATLPPHDGALIPHSPQFPHAGGDITTSHDADITYHTIVPPHSGERLNLHDAIWICLANADIKAQRRQELSQAA
ncbi:MAG TPA: hypothetical protein VHZ03_53055 [Trebonia sp.]|nr:hypothetical protein [Trebonia sp.]